MDIIDEQSSEHSDIIEKNGCYMNDPPFITEELIRRTHSSKSAKDSGGGNHGNVSAVAGETVEVTMEIGFVEQMTYTQIGPSHRAVEADTIV
eukprot:366171-Karenia_brevis.AAC.1